MAIHDLLTNIDDKTLDQVRRFAKVPPDVDDDILKMEILGARKKVMTAVGDELDTFYDDNPIFQSAVLIDMYTHYVNRDKESTAMVFDSPVYQDDINAMKDDYRTLVAGIDEEETDGSTQD